MEYPIPLQSLETSALIKALSSAQGEFKSAKKETVNPFFKSHYADFASVWDAVRDALCKYKLLVNQHTLPIEGTYYVVTVVRHETGQHIASYYPIITGKQDAQGFGSGTTYAKRYSLQTLLCVPAGEDDDAESTYVRGDNDRTHHQGPGGVGLHERQASQSTNQAGPAKSPSPSEAQIKRLYAICKASGWNKEDLVSHMQKVLGITSTKDLTWIQYENICSVIQAMPKTIQNEAH